MTKYSFPPISSPDAKVLILGTMPGEKSLSLSQYYGHGGNNFWKILFTLFNETLSPDYETRKGLLIKYKIALWDVLCHCEREGSSDNKIEAEYPNNFNDFYNTHPHIQFVFFNGNNAALYYDNYIKRSKTRQYFVLPSTSRANTWKSYEEKLQEWKSILKALEQ